MKSVRELIAELQKEDQDAPVIAYYWLPTDFEFHTGEWDEMSPTAAEFRKLDIYKGAIDYASDELGQAINDEVYAVMSKERN